MGPVPESQASVDVLIIGAGPAGLMSAHALATAGVAVRIVDQRPHKVPAGQADGIQPRTIEVLQSYGLAERLLKEGNQMYMAAFYNPSTSGEDGIELTDRVPDIAAATARYPFEVTLHQGAIESIFLDSLNTMGVRVERPVTPISLQISEDEDILRDPSKYAVNVELKHLDKPVGSDIEVVKAKFVIGADGAHSWVRKTLNVTMEGEQTEFIWGVIDMVPETNFPDIRNKSVVHSDNGSCMVIPREGDTVRLYIQLEGTDIVDPISGRVDKSKVGPHQLLEVARRSFRPYTFETPSSFKWWTVYSIGQRVASTFSVHDRVFLSGDAGKTHSPKAGQGMNAGINDGHNLAWKLSLVLRGWANISLLETYNLERRKYAQDLIDFDKKWANLFSGKPRTEENQDGVSHEDFLKIFQTFGGFTSGIGIHYADSVLVDSTQQLAAKHIIIGERVPSQFVIRAADSRPFHLHDILPFDSRFKILAFIGNPNEAAQRMKIQIAAETLQNSLLKCSPGGAIESLFDIVSISSANKKDIQYNTLPLFFRSHWSKAFIDDTDVTGTLGGMVYSSLGVEPAGAIIVVRPDGYVGMITRLDGTAGIESYFERFLNKD